MTHFAHSVPAGPHFHHLTALKETLSFETPSLL